MERILALAFVEDGPLPRGAMEALQGAVDLSRSIEGSTLSVGLIGQRVEPAAGSLAGCGAARFLGVEGPEVARPRYASDVAAAEALARRSEATLVMIPNSSRAARIAGGLAQRLGGRVDTHVVGLRVRDGEPRIDRWYYRQRMLATLSRTTRPWVLLLEGGVFEPWRGESGTADVEAVAVAWPSFVTRNLGEEAAGTKAQTIRPDADLLFVAGAGWTKKQADGQSHIAEAEERILGFLEASGASLGSSKSLVDLSSEGQDILAFMTHLNQVGQTGSSPRHPKGLATCCHGEEPHVVGWRFIKERRAVNLDPNCGWARGKADVLYVADAFEVMAKVNDLLS